MTDNVAKFVESIVTMKEIIREERINNNLPKFLNEVYNATTKQSCALLSLIINNLYDRFDDVQ